MSAAATDWFDQQGWSARFEWGLDGLRALAPGSGAVVVVDVLRFTTAVDVAVARGAVVHPYRWHDGTEAGFAAERGAVVAERTTSTEPGPPWSLSPASLASIPEGQGLVLPSPNGSTLCHRAAEAGASAVFAGCLRNAAAVAVAADAAAGARPVLVIAAGERWGGPAGSLRPAIEDLLGAGAVLSALVARGREPSPEAELAVAAFERVRDRLDSVLAGSASGRELIGRGMGADLPLAAALDASTTAPRLEGDRFVAVRAPGRVRRRSDDVGR